MASRERDRPAGRWKRVLTPTPNQLKYKLSGYERAVGQEIDYWNRGLQFTWLWEQIGKSWHWYEQFWFFRGTREWWILYVPFFWRSGSEFLKFEKRFIEEALRKHGTMPQREFIRMAESVKAKLFYTSIQGPLLGALSGGGWAGMLAQTMEKINDIDNYHDMIKCGMQEKGYEEACAKVISGQLMSGAKRSISR